MIHAFTTLATDPTEHIADVTRLTWQMDLFGMKGVWIWSSHVGNLVLAGFLTVLTLGYAASRIKTGPDSQGNDRYITKGAFAHMIEVICVYLREVSVRPLLGKRTDTFMPFLWTLFFFILISNFLGLFPIADLFEILDHITGKEIFIGLAGATATQNIFVTSALAIVAAIVINIAGLRELGVGGYLKHLTAGTPFYLWPLMVPIEILGTIIKPVALALRLFANMTAGHMLVAVLLMFAGEGLHMVAKGTAGGVFLGGTISLVSIIANIAIMFLELFVALLQAFVFMFLTAVFISLLSHHHDHGHEEAHDHEHAHAH